MIFPIFSKLFKNKQSDQELYLGLFLKEEEGVAFIINKKQEYARLLAKEKFTYSNGWENLTEDVDNLLFKLETDNKVKVDKVIFFIYSHLIDQNSKIIKKSYLIQIKEMLKNLELKPVGFIECYEAVVAKIEEKEEMSLTGLLIEIDTVSLNLFLFKGGHKTSVKLIPRTGNTIEDLIVGLREIKETTLLPSRIILYNSRSLSNVASQIVSYPWESEYFIQPPRVEIVTEEEVETSLVNFFSKQIDSTTDTEVKESKSKKEVMGFVIGGEVEVEEKVIKKSSFKLPDFKLYFKKIMGLFSFLHIKGSLMIPIIGIALIIISLTLIEVFLHKAKITLLFASKKIEKTVDLVTTVDENNPDNLYVYTATVGAQLKKSLATTGKKQIGESSRGEVTLYNFDDKEKVFTKGTTLQTNSLKFILDNDVKVASSSLTNDASAKLPGKSKGKITAADIGPEGNLTKGQRFNIGDLSASTYFAINESALSGGTKKEIRTVAKKDQDDLKAMALEEGKKNLKTKSQLKQDEKVIDSLTTFELSNLIFSKEIGEEATSVDLTAKVLAYYYVYKLSDFQNFVKKTIKNDIPVGYSINSEDLVFNIEDSKLKANNLSANIELKVKASRYVNSKDIIKKIIGKNIVEMGEMLKKDYQISGWEKDIKPKFPIFKDRLPLLEKNIEIKISSL